MRQRFFWSGLGAAALACAVALATPAEAQKLVFDVSINSYSETDLAGNSTFTPFNLQFTQVFNLSGLPASGSSLYSTVHLLNLDVADNVAQTTGVTTSSPLDAAQDALASLPTSLPLNSSNVSFSAERGTSRVLANYYQENNASIQMSYNWGVASPDGSQAMGSDLALNLSYNQNIQGTGPFPPPDPLTINQMLDVIAGYTWNYSYTADSYDIDFAPDGSETGTISDREYYGTATIDLSQSSLTPEPQAWALMILGFGAVGAMARARRRALAPHA